MSAFLKPSLFVGLFLLLAGCSRQSSDNLPALNPAKTAAPAATTNATAALEPETPVSWTQELIHKATKHFNPAYTGQGQFHIEEGRILAAQLPGTGVTDLTMFVGQPLQMIDLRGLKIEDLTALTGAPLIEVYLEETRVTDLSPLRGAPIRKLYLSNTPVSDLSPLAKCPIEELNLVSTGVGDVSPLASMPLGMLWLTGSPVSDIGPLKSCPLVSLTLESTRVTDLSPLSGTALQRLHIGNTPVSDLSPLKGMRLTRLIFDPSRVTDGIDGVRNMPTLSEIGPAFDKRMKPAQFWSMYDAQKAAPPKQTEQAPSPAK